MKNKTQTRLFSAEIQGKANRLMASAVKLTMVSCDPSLAATSEMLLFRAWVLSSLVTNAIHFYLLTVLLNQVKRHLNMCRDMMIYISLNMCSLVPKAPYEAISRPGRPPLNLEMPYMCWKER